MSNNGVIRKAVEGEAAKHNFPEERDYRAGVRYGGALAERTLRSDEAVATAADTLFAHHKIDMEFRPLRCSCGEWDPEAEGWVKHQARAVVIALAGEGR